MSNIKYVCSLYTNKLDYNNNMAEIGFSPKYDNLATFKIKFIKNNAYKKLFDYLLKCFNLPKLPDYKYNVYNDRLRETSDYDEMKDFLPIEVKEAVDKQIKLSEKLTIKSKTYIVESINKKTNAQYGKNIKVGDEVYWTTDLSYKHQSRIVYVNNIPRALSYTSFNLFINTFNLKEKLNPNIQNQHDIF